MTSPRVPELVFFQPKKRGRKPGSCKKRTPEEEKQRWENRKRKNREAAARTRALKRQKAHEQEEKIQEQAILIEKLNTELQQYHAKYGPLSLEIKETKETKANSEKPVMTTAQLMEVMGTLNPRPLLDSESQLIESPHSFTLSTPSSSSSGFPFYFRGGLLDNEAELVVESNDQLHHQFK